MELTNVKIHVDWFREARPSYESLTDKNVALLRALLKDAALHGFVESRVKSVSGFEEKCSRPGKNYSNPSEEITDLSGIRIVLSSLTEVQLAESLIREEFFVDDERSVNKRATIKPAEFGYLSTHLIVRTHDKRKDLREWRNVGPLWSEIQIRTALEHAWAVASHTVTYKSEAEIPSELSRQLIQISGMLENVDAQLDQVIGKARDLRAEYKRDISSQKLEIELNLDSFSAYVETSRIIAPCLDRLSSLDMLTDAGTGTENIETPLAFAQSLGFTSISQIDDAFHKLLPWGIDAIIEFMRQFAEENNSPTVKIPVAGVLSQLIVMSQIGSLSVSDTLLRISWPEDVIERFFGVVEKHRPAP